MNGGTPIKHEFYFYDKDVDELNEKKKMVVKVRQNCIGVSEISLDSNSNDVRIGGRSTIMRLEENGFCAIKKCIYCVS